MSAETCPVEVADDWSVRTCRRPVKRNGMCGIHASAEDQRVANALAREARMAQAAAESAAMVERLARHGIEARVGYGGDLWTPGWKTIADALDAKYGEQA